MIIQNIFFTNKRYDKNNIPYQKLYSKQPAFTSKADILTKEVKLSANEMKKFSAIASLFDSVYSVFSSMSGAAKVKFKKIYSKLVLGENINGFIFNPENGLFGKKFQVVRFKPKSDSDELITLSVLGQKNENMLRYRVSRDGNVLISADPEKLKEIPGNPYERPEEFYGALDEVTDNMSEFKFYSDNYKTLQARMRQTKYHGNIFDEIASLRCLQDTPSKIDKAVKISETYNHIISLLRGSCVFDAPRIKQSFFKNLFSPMQKGLVFDDIIKDKKVVLYQSKSIKDDRCFSITITDSNDKYCDMFMFFKDGRVCRIVKPPIPGVNRMRKSNFAELNSIQLKEYGLHEIVDKLETRLNDFAEYISKFKADKKLHAKKRGAPKKVDKTTKKHKVSKTSKTVKAEKKVKVKNKIKAADSIKTDDKIKATDNVKAKGKIKPEDKNKVKNKLKEIKGQEAVKPVSEFVQKEINLSQILENLNKLFALPVEKRNPKLIHEKLPNGKMFAGRFTMRASDGAEIVVSRVKSPKYVEFLYYSIRCNNKDKGFILNLDPEVSGRIIKSKNGKPAIDNNYRIMHISKEKYMDENPQAKNLPMYLSEIFDSDV